MNRKAVSPLPQKTPSTQEVTTHVTQTYEFTPRPETNCHNDLGIDDREFFTNQFVQTATQQQFSDITSLLANRWQSLDHIIQEVTTYPDFESFKMAAFAAYLQQHDPK